MHKLAITILVFRVLQAGLGLAFLIFWIWACASQFVVGGGAGEYFFGYFTALASLAVCAHGFWSFAKRQHLEQHKELYHHARWAIDLLIVALWIGIFFIQLFVPTKPEEWRAQIGGGGPSTSESRPSHIAVVELGVANAQLFSIITFMFTAIFCGCAAYRSIRAQRKGESKGKGPAQDTTTDTGVLEKGSTPDATTDTGVQEEAPAPTTAMVSGALETEPAQSTTTNTGVQVSKWKRVRTHGHRGWIG